MSDINELVSLYLIMLQEIYDYTQTELAKQLDITQGCLSKIQQRKQGANARVIIRAYRLAPVLFAQTFHVRGPASVIRELHGHPTETVRAAVRSVRETQGNASYRSKISPDKKLSRNDG